MGKKGAKKKTIWRTLSIGDIAATSTTNGSTKEIKKEYKTSFKIDSVSQPINTRNGKLSSTSSELSNNENRNSFNTNNIYDKYNSNSNNAALSNSTSPHQQYNKTYLPYKRRPFSSKSLNYSNYYSNNNSSSSAGGNYRSNYRYRTNNYYSSSDASNKDSSSQNNQSSSTEKKESNFNEDEYTRITTPRQDVLFKKGYLSKPKKYLKYSDLHTPSSSGAMSIVSTEESTTTSTQSVTPENFNSIPENPDESEFSPYSYPSFFDQNGLYYVNPYSFDPYGGQMFMMPYPTSANCQQPFNTTSFDIYDNSQTSTSPVSFNQNNGNTENNEDSSPTEEQVTSDTNNVDDVTEHDKENVKETISCEENAPVKNINLNEAEDGSLENRAAGINEGKDENLKIEENDVNAVFDYPNDNAPYYHPFMYYPYYYCPPHSMFPVNDLSYTNGFGIPYDNTLGNKYFKYKKRKRKPRKTLNSSGVTTDDCSEDESSDNENHCSYHYIPYAMTQTSETTKCYLNVEVEEFQPKCYTPKMIDVVEKSQSTENLAAQKKNEATRKENLDVSSNELPVCPKNNTPIIPNYSNVLKMESKDINKKTAINNINLNNKSINNKAKKKNNKKTVPKTEVINSGTKEPKISQFPPNEPTYAQMLNGIKKTSSIETTHEKDAKTTEIVNNEIAPEKEPTPKRDVKWQTVVKSKGKRGKNIQIDVVDVSEEVNEEIIEPQLEIRHDTLSTNNTNIESTTSNDADALTTSPNIMASTSTIKLPAAKPKTKSRSSKRSTKRKNMQIKSQHGFEVIEPTFAPLHDTAAQHYTDDELIEFDSFIDEVQDVINDNVEAAEDFMSTADIIKEDNFTNFHFIETDELDKDFDIIEKKDIEIEVKMIKNDTIPVEPVEKVFYAIEEEAPVVEKGIVIDLVEELKNGCAIENKINGQVEEIIEKITVNEIESICNKIELELSINDNQVTENEIIVDVVSPNVIEVVDGGNENVTYTKLDDLCDKNQEETEEILLSNNDNENVVTVTNENICVKENGLSSSLIKFPLTEAVTKWLFEKENQKSTVTEPVLRLPNDPILSSKIQLMILSRTQYYDDADVDDDDDDEWTTESETELEHDQESKNFIRNPLPVSSHNSSNEDINNISVIDTDSDYMSDSQIRADDNTRKWVAAYKNYDSDTTVTAKTTTKLSGNNQSKLYSKSLDNNSTKTIDKCIKLPFTDVCCVLM